MSHGLDYSTGKAAMAYVGEVPWHELGVELAAGAPIETWIKAAGLDWSLVNQPVMYRHGDGIRRMEDWFVLARSDTGEAMSVVSEGYLPVQPKQVMEFYRDLTKDFGYALETAGALNGGRKIWALAKTGYRDCISGGADEIRGYLLLATSCDKSMATTATFTGIRVVCQNTLRISLSQAGTTKQRAIKIPHSKVFDPSAIKKQLGLIDKDWQQFIKSIRRFAECKVNDGAAEIFFENLLKPSENKKGESKPLSLSAALECQRLMSAYRTGVGQDTPTAKGTAWGLVNAVTFHVDHVRSGKDGSARLNSAWFGPGANLKDKAWDQALLLLDDQDSI